MRTIKFRAWNSDEKIMSKPFKLIHDEELYSDTHVVMQFTGLQDKNGKEIYEGDVVELNNTKYDIVFIEGEFCGANDNGESIQMFEVINGSVIGNIYEHSELLTQ